MTMSQYNRAELECVSKIVDRAAIRLYAEITDDFNPIHVDPEFAATTPMRGIIAHGMLSLNLIWQSLRATYGSQAQDGARHQHADLDILRETGSDRHHAGHQRQCSNRRQPR
jgi:acyl dehydratase